MTKELIEKNNTDPIDKFICVGGSSNMSQVIDGLKDAFKGLEIQVFEPEKAVALGAAIYAQFCAGRRLVPVLSDIAPYSYGIRCYENYAKNPNREIIVNLILKGDRLPKESQHGFSTIFDGQKALLFNPLSARIPPPL